MNTQKPSERIEEIVRTIASGTENAVYIATIIKFLDEQWEKQQAVSQCEHRFVELEPNKK